MGPSSSPRYRDRTVGLRERTDQRSALRNDPRTHSIWERSGGLPAINAYKQIIEYLRLALGRHVMCKKVTFSVLVSASLDVQPTNADQRFCAFSPF